MLFRTYGKLVNHPHINTDIIIRWRSEKISHDIENRKKRNQTQWLGNTDMPQKYFRNLRMFTLKKRRPKNS